MKDVRRGMLLSVIVAVGGATGLGFWLVDRVSPEAALTRLWVDLGAFVFLLLAVVGFTAEPRKRIDELVEALRTLGLGNRDRRLDADQFAELSPVASAFNELAATLSDGQDPNLGPVQTVRRSRLEASSGDGEGDSRATAAAGPVDPTAANIEERSDVGHVRVLQKSTDDADESDVDEDEATGLAPQDDESPTVSPTSSDVEDESNESGDQQAQSQDDDSEEAAAADIDDDGADEEIDDERAEDSATADDDDLDDDTSDIDDDDGPMANITVLPMAAERLNDTLEGGGDDFPAPAESDPGDRRFDPTTIPVERLPEEEDVSAEEQNFSDLFNLFLEKKQERNESIDGISFDVFASALRAEQDRLLAENKCRSVRFEVTVHEGAVSLQPRIRR